MSLEQCQLDAERQWIEEWDSGPVYLRWTEVPLQSGDRAPAAQVIDFERRAVNLSQLWAEGAALVLFWRHFGCGCGLDRIKRLKQEIARYGELGASVTIVGQGDPELAAEYRRKYDLPVPILSDPSRDAFRAYGVLEGRPEQILYDASEEMLRRDAQAGRSFAAERKAMGRPPVNSPWQLPAEFVVDGTGVVQLAYRYQYCEDFPDARVITSVLERLA